MKAPGKITPRHLGRKSTISLTASSEQIGAFLRLLVEEQFFMESKRRAGNETTWTLGRKIRLMAGDWPMKVVVEQSGEDVTIAYGMFTPWGWIIALAVMVFFFLPFISIRGASLVFLLGIGVIAMAIYKQQFDCSPGAWWQGPPRQRWNDRMIRLATEAFLKDRP